MTNTRITDPEVLEARFPVRLRRFAIRRGSGGAGANPGGDGVIRELELLEPLQISLVSQRRTIAPFGLAGGESGARGRNLLDGDDLGRQRQRRRAGRRGPPPRDAGRRRLGPAPISPRAAPSSRCARGAVLIKGSQPLPQRRTTMALVTRRDNGNPQVSSRTRDPFSMFRDLLSWDPYVRAVSTFNPRFEIKERPDGFLFTADLPGVAEEDLDISLQNGVLTISGRRAAEQRQEREPTTPTSASTAPSRAASRSPTTPTPTRSRASSTRRADRHVGKRSEAKPRKVQLSKS